MADFSETKAAARQVKSTTQAAELLARWAEEDARVRYGRTVEAFDVVTDSDELIEHLGFDREAYKPLDD